MKPDLHEGACDNTYHIIKKGVAGDKERQQLLILLLQLRKIQRTDGCFCGSARGLKRGKIMRPDQCGKGGTYLRRIQRDGNVPAKISIQRRGMPGVPDPVGVGLSAGQKPRVKVRGNFPARENTDVRGQQIVEYKWKFFRRNGGSPGACESDRTGTP